MRKTIFGAMALALILGSTLTVSAQNNTQDKMSPWLAEQAVDGSDKPYTGRWRSPLAMPHRRGYVLALVKTTDGEQTLRRHDCAIVCDLGPAYAAFVPTDQLEALCGETTILQMEANEAPRPMLDKMGTLTRAAEAWQGTLAGLPQAFTGQGVVAASIDVGFDFTHPAFLDDDGRSRYSWFWDFSLSADNMLGTVYDDGGTMLSARCSSDAQENYHATHVMGILGGRGLGDGRYSGIAYDAELMGATMVVGLSDDTDHLFDDFIRSQVEQGEWPETFLSVTKSDVILLVELKAIFDRADAEGKPCVVNLSLGRNLAFDSRTTLTEEVIDSMLGPGHVIVASAGNEGMNHIYARKEAGEDFSSMLALNDDYSRLTMRCDAAAPDFDITFIFGNNSSTLAPATPLHMSSAAVDSVMARGEEWLADSVLNSLAAMVGRSEYELVRMKRIDAAPGTRCYVLEADMCNMAKVFSALGSSAASITIGGEPEIEMLGKIGKFEFDGHGSTSEDPGMQPYTITFPGTMERVLTVGALNFRNSFVNEAGIDTTDVKLLDYGEGRLATFSSCGPTIDGRVKPDVTAPGHNIIAPLNSYTEWLKVRDSIYIDIERAVGGKKVATVDGADGRPYSVMACSGTSMSSPAVAGIVALWLQANPTLTPEDVMQVVRETSHQPADAPSAEKNNVYGYGLIDAYAGLLHILGISKVLPAISTSQPTALSILPEGENAVALHFAKVPSRPFTVSLYTTSGQLTGQQTITPTTATSYRMALGQTLRGVYVVQVQGGETGVTGSSLIRF